MIPICCVEAGFERSDHMLEIIKKNRYQRERNLEPEKVIKPLGNSFNLGYIEREAVFEFSSNQKGRKLH